MANPTRPSRVAGWAFYEQSFKYLVHLDPTFDNNHHSAVDRHGVVNEVALERLEAWTQAGRGDGLQQLAPFASSDRKLIIFHGYSDGFINPFRAIRFDQDWAKLRDGYEVLQQHSRQVHGAGHILLQPGAGAERLRRAGRPRAVGGAHTFRRIG